MTSDGQVLAVSFPPSMDTNPEIELVTPDNAEEPYMRASTLAKWLEYKETDQVSKICNRRKEDFNEKDIFLDKSGNLWLNYDGALKVCMFSAQPKAREAREEVIRVYRSWRNGGVPAYEEMSPSRQAYSLAKAVMQLAEEQMKQEKILKEHDKAITHIDHRLSVVEAKQTGGFISEAQGAQITVAVRGIGSILASGQGGRNMYGVVYTKMYEQFGVTTYKNIPADMFPEVMGWLNKLKSHVIKSIEGEKNTPQVE